MQDEHVYPVSFAQQSLLFLDQLDPGSTAYNLCWAIRLKGPLNLSRLRESFRRVVERQASLRTRFIHSDEGYQVVSTESGIDLPIMDITHVSRDMQDQHLQTFANGEARRPFDLTVGPLFKATIVKFSDTHHVLFIVIHHIITDGWSMSILFKEIGAFYSEISSSRPATMPVISIQYPDFSQWQRRTFTPEYLLPDLKYWTSKLQGHEGVLALPTDRPRLAVQNHAGAVVRFKIETPIVHALRRLADGADATLFMILFSAFVTLLHRYTNSEDIVVGTPTAGRDNSQLESLFGLFVNTLAIRTDLSGNPSFLELLRRVRQATLDAFDHRALPFERLVEALRLKRSLSFSPLFQVMFIFQNIPKQILELAGLTLTSIDLDSVSAKYDLTLEVVEDEGLLCSFEYSSTLFDKDSIEQLARSFVTLLCAITDHPDRTVGELEIIDPVTRGRLVGLSNPTAVPYRRDARIEELFKEQAERTPDREALIEGNTKISYRELDSRADALAAFFSTLELDQAGPVGVFLPRSIGAVTAFLAALKANAPYVPLDVSNPPHRLQLMMSHAGCKAVVTSRELRNLLPGETRAILIDEPATWYGAAAADKLGRASGDLAYVIYTSGSTGVPKGVEGTHRAVINRFEWMWRVYPFGPGEWCCHKTALGFVDSVWEIFGPLLAGVPAVIVPDEVLLDPIEFVDLLAQHAVTRVVLVPSLLRALLDIVPDLADRLPNLKMWSVSGEALPVDLAKRFRDAVPRATLVNIYGSAEVTADVTYHEVAELEQISSVPIGRPISNVHVFVLDKNRMLVPPLVTGEMLVGGDCLARGYWGQPDLTSQRFIQSPLDGTSRLFVTGDLGRLRPDGIIEYLGRMDRQIKLRGMRIELGEIEACLASHPDVRETSVLLRGDSSERQRLVAYFVRRMGSSLSTEELRPFLKQRIPDYMVPSEFVELERIPLLPSGKLDRLALETAPPLLSGRRGVDGHARTEAEKKLSAIWKEVLDLDDVGINDDFFDLGGHSLGAMRVLARVRRDFNVDIPVRKMFERPTIAEFVLEVEKHKATGRAVEERPIAPTADTTTLLKLMRSQLGALSSDQMESILQALAAEKNSRARGDDQ
jgi:amino acid adenylation domain-containing protein